MCAEALQQRNRHAGEELHASRLQPINKLSNFNHLSPSFQMRGTSQYVKNSTPADFNPSTNFSMPQSW